MLEIEPNLKKKSEEKNKELDFDDEFKDLVKENENLSLEIEKFDMERKIVKEKIKMANSERLKLAREKNALEKALASRKTELTEAKESNLQNKDLQEKKDNELLEDKNLPKSELLEIEEEQIRIKDKLLLRYKKSHNTLTFKKEEIRDLLKNGIFFF